jgi:hypothetical protein
MAGVNPALPPRMLSEANSVLGPSPIFSLVDSSTRWALLFVSELGVMTGEWLLPWYLYR